MHTGTTGRLDINLTPLLDLVLQLIMFFMLTVNFVRVDQANERVDLPVVQSAMPLVSTGDSLVYINIDKDGQRLAGGAKLATKQQLRTYVKEQQGYDEFIRRLRAFLDATVPGYVREGKSYLTIGVGCARGNVVAEEIASATNHQPRR